MKNNLPYLNQERLNTLFDHVYDIVNIQIGETSFEDERLNHLLETLKAMQSFNYHHRPDDTRELFGLLDPIFNFDRNSEGTTLWLSMMLAIKDMYGFSRTKLAEVVKQVSVRK